jgi:hypothetical protein
MNHEKILADAKAAPSKVILEEYREAVQELRQKGFTWREIADFLTERGVAIDHTRVYRMFEQQKKQRRTESRPVNIYRITYLGEQMTRKKKTWKVMEIELLSKLDQPITVIGYIWGTGAARFAIGDDDTIEFREATLVTKLGGGFPLAYIKAEFRAEGDYWSPQEVYIVPKWEAIL